MMSYNLHLRANWSDVHTLLSAPPPCNPLNYCCNVGLEETMLCCYLGDEQNHQRDVDGEDDGQGGEGEGGVLLGGQDHGDWSCYHTQHLRGQRRETTC